MFISSIITTNCNEKLKLDTWSKRTQSKPTCGEQSRTICSELARPERGRRVEPILLAGKEFEFFDAQGVP
jgi:SUMO ligase MMS21 Smc5/6 complex component